MSILRVAASWFSSTPLHPQWLMEDRLVLPEVAGSKGVVLDIGSATRWLRSRLDPDASYIALDYPATATALYGTRPDVHADARALPIATASIDVVVCLEVLEHVESPERALEEMHRVLKPGGIAMVSMPFLYPVHDAPHDFQRWTSHGWVAQAGQAGFKVRRLEPVGHSIHAAAVLAALAVTGPLQGARAGSLSWRVPLAVPIVLLVNLSAWCLAWLWPRWSAMCTGHRLLLEKGP